jgi:hypothetical protein
MVVAALPTLTIRRSYIAPPMILSFPASMPRLKLDSPTT